LGCTYRHYERGALRFPVVFPIALLILGAVVVFLPAMQKRLRRRATLRNARRTAKEVWTTGSGEQRRAMLDLIDVVEGPDRDSQLTKVWDELAEPVRTSITKNFRR